MYRLIVILALMIGPTLAVSADGDSGVVDQVVSENVAGIADVPLMPGLTEQFDETVIFDKPGGRLVLAVAEGQNRERCIRDYYLAELPERGWALEGAPVTTLVFTRGKEQLEISIDLIREISDSADVSPDRSRVSFRLSPR